MAHTVTQGLNGQFGAMIAGVSLADLKSPEFQDQSLSLWHAHGLFAVRGDELADIAPTELVDWSGVFGVVEEIAQSGRDKMMVSGYPILRIGNVRDDAGELVSSLARVPQLTSDNDIRYNPETRRPVWHTDSLFRENPPIGSVFHCKQAPSIGAETLFADMRAAYTDLDDQTKSDLRGLEAVCSLAHHDKKINSYSPDYPILSPEQRALNPARRVPVVLPHPDTGVPALYGLNSSTCAVVPIGADVSDEDMDRYDLEGVEDESVQILRGLLPTVTGPEYTVKWSWQPGDIVVWDNRCTMHSGTGFDFTQYTREMWRLTLLSAAAGA
tara:strand:+ start:3993 stop:4970 length:978 start_codon:yes stop_codon:yes gene_type:complete